MNGSRRRVMPMLSFVTLRLPRRCILLFCWTVSLVKMEQAAVVCEAFHLSSSYPTHHPLAMRMCLQPPLPTTRLCSSLSDLDDTDDEYYERLFESELGDEEDEDEEDFSLGGFGDMSTLDEETENVILPPQSHQTTQALVKNPENEPPITDSPQERRNKRRKQRLARRAKEMALASLGLERLPRLHELVERERYKKALALHKRLLQVLEEQSSRAYQRAKQQVSLREAQMAALQVGNHTITTSRGEYLDMISKMRDQEVTNQRRFTEGVFAKPDEATIEKMSTEELLSILRVRDNLFVGRTKRRDLVLGLLHQSFEEPLY